jgi:hypothetical protein
MHTCACIILAAARTRSANKYFTYVARSFLLVLSRNLCEIGRPHHVRTTEYTLVEFHVQSSSYVLQASVYTFHGLGLLLLYFRRFCKKGVLITKVVL